MLINSGVGYKLTGMSEERGRPSLFTQDIADQICRQMATGMSLREICRQNGMPAESTVRLWAVEDYQGFSAQYTRARQALADYWADEVIDIADNSANDWMVRQQGEGEIEIANHDHINRSRLRVDTRKWLLSKVLPKVYGDKTTNEHTGPNGGPMQFVPVDTGIKRG